MNLLISSSNDPYFNLATEEYLLKNSSEDYVFFYVNKPCVVVGKHQNTLKEINNNYIFHNNVLIARRLSGGGAVYHDEGNLNFSYIQTISLGENISYKIITHSIFNFLQQLVPELTLSERNDFLLNGKKISGSAMHVYKNRVLAHGTLLVDCNLPGLSAALKGNPHRYNDKSIASKRSVVMNLSDTNKKISIDFLLKKFSLPTGEKNPTMCAYSLPDSVLEPIQKLAKSKYSTDEWIYGYSPKYTYQNCFTFHGNIINYTLLVVKGIIEDIIIERKEELDKYIIIKMNNLKGYEHNIFSMNTLLNSVADTDIDQLLYSSLF
jgi:lipoate-protein ligase A